MLKILVASFKRIVSWLVIVLWLQLCCHKFYVFILQFTTAIYMTVVNTAQEDCGTKATRQWLLSGHMSCPNQVFPLVQVQTSEEKKKALQKN